MTRAPKIDTNTIGFDDAQAESWMSRPRLSLGRVIKHRVAPGCGSQWHSMWLLLSHRDVSNQGIIKVLHRALWCAKASVVYCVMIT